MKLLKQSTAATIKFGPFLDDTTGKDAETGLAASIKKANVRLSLDGGNMAAAHADQGSSDAGAPHDEIGYYDLSLDTTDTATVGRLKIMAHVSGALPVWDEYLIVPANVYDAMRGADKLQVDAAESAMLLELTRTRKTRYFDRTRGPASAYTLSAAEALDLIDQNLARGGTIHVIRSGDNLETSLAGGAQYDVWLLMPAAYSVTEVAAPSDALIIGVGGSVTIQGGATHPFASGARLTIAGIGGALAITGTHLAPTAGMTLYNCAVTGGDYGASSDDVSWNAWNCTFAGALNGVLIAADAVTVNLYGCSCTATPASDLECAAAKIAGSGVLSIYEGTMTATQYSGGTQSAYAAVGAILYGVTDASTSGTSGCTVYASVDDDPLQQLLGDVDGTPIESRLNSTVVGRIDAAISSRSTYAGGDTAGTTTLLSRVTGTVLLASGYTAPDNASVAAIKAKTDNLPASPAAVGSAMALTSDERTTLAGVIWNSLTSGMSTVGSIGKRIVDYLTGDIFARLGAPSGASIAADIAAVGDLTGSGAYAVTATVTDGTNPLQGVKVRLVAGADQPFGTSAADGTIAFNLDAKTFAVAATLPGYQFSSLTAGTGNTISGSNVTVTGAGGFTVVMAAVVASAPASPSCSTGTLVCIGTDGEPEANVAITFKQTSIPSTDGYAYDGREFQATSDANGLVQHTGFIIGASYQARRAGGEWTTAFTIANAASFTLPEMLGRPQ